MEKILDRIRKLLALATSANEHEAANAAARAAELMQEHQIEEADLEAAKPEHERTAVPPARQIIDHTEKWVAWRAYLVSGLAQAAGGMSYSNRSNGVNYYVVAPSNQFDTIRYLFAYLTKEVDRLADDAFSEEARECMASGITPPGARAWKSAFRVGASVAIYSRLCAQRQQTHANAAATGHTQALMIVDKQKSDALALARREVPDLFTKSGKMRAGSSSSAGQSSSTGYAAGRDAGKSVNLGGNKSLGAGAQRRLT